jgi:hypothetical protein
MLPNLQSRGFVRDSMLQGGRCALLRDRLAALASTRRRQA